MLDERSEYVVSIVSERIVCNKRKECSVLDARIAISMSRSAIIFLFLEMFVLPHTVFGGSEPFTTQVAHRCALKVGLLPGLLPGRRVQRKIWTGLSQLLLQLEVCSQNAYPHPSL